MVAECSYCDQLMEVGNGCLIAFFDDFGDGQQYSRIPCDQDRCGDCNVTAGQFHHPGCDQEQCPKCYGQAISCDCVQ